MAIDFDKVLRRIGEFGKYQLIRFILLNLAVGCLFQYTLYSLIFITFEPSHNCTAILIGNQSISIDPQINNSLGSISGRGFIEISDDQCSARKYLKYLNGSMSSSFNTHKCTAWAYDQTEYISTIVTEWNLICDKKWWVTVILTTSNISMAIGTLIFALIQDSLGRKLGFFIALAVCIIPGTAIAGAPGPIVLIVLRCFQASMTVSGWTFPYILCLEIVGPTKRTLVTSVMVAVFAIGASSIGLVAWLCNNWVTLQLVSTLPFLVFFLYWPIIDESPRWLFTMRRTAKLRELVKKIANTNQKPFKKGEVSLFINESRLISHVSVTASKNKTSIIDLFRKSNLRRKTIIICYLYIANAVVYTGLAFNVENLQGNRFFIFSLLMLMEVPAGIAINFTLDRFGRIMPMSIAMVLGGLAAIGTSQIPAGQPIIICLMAALSKFGISGSFAILCQLAGELFPTQLRGTGTGLGGFLGNLSTVAIPFIIESAQTMKSLPMIVMGLLSVSGGLVVLLLPETLGVIMPETVTDCDDTSVGIGMFWGNVTFRSIREARESIVRREETKRNLVPTDLTKFAQFKPETFGATTDEDV